MFEISGLEEIAIVLGVLVAAVVLFLLWRMGFLTKKTLPIVGGALAALGALVFVRSKKRDQVNEEIEAKEKELAEREKRLEELKGDAETSERELEEAEAELDRAKAKHKRELAKIEAETEEEKRRIDSLSTDELLDEFGDSFGSQPREGGS